MADRVFDAFVGRMGSGCTRALKDDASAIQLLSNWIAGEVYEKVSLLVAGSSSICLHNHAGLF